MDWEDIETLGLLEIFMEYAEHAAGTVCHGKKGWIRKKFDEGGDSKMFQGPEYMAELTKKSGKCWTESEGGPKVMIGRL